MNNIYLNNPNPYYTKSSSLKSSGKAMVFYPTDAFILFCSYTNLGLFTEFLPINERLLPYVYISGLLSGISFTLIITILST